MPNERGRGRGKSKGRGSKDQSNARRSLDFVGAASTSSELEKARTARARDNKNIKKLSADDRKKLVAAKRQKEMSRILIPDAPAKKSRKQSPEREPCHLVEGTPPTLPAPERQPWRGERDESPQGRQSPALSTTKTPTARSSLKNLVQVSNSGSSMRSIIEVPNLSPSYWKAGVDLDIEIECCSISESEDEARQASFQSTSMRDTSPIVIVIPNESPEEELSKLPTSQDFHIYPEPIVVANEDIEEIEEWEEPQPFISREVAVPSSATVPEDLEPSLRHWLDQTDILNDRELIRLASPDSLTFDWRNERGVFKGKRETFTGCAGPTLSVKDLHPVDVFLKIWDTELLDIIVRETNVYAIREIAKANIKEHSRLKTWTPTDRQELLTFFAFLMFQGMVPLPVEVNYFKTSERLAIPGLANIITYNRFLLIKKFLHFNSEPDGRLSAKERQRRKLGQIPDYLNRKFSELYIPGQNIAIDESLLHWSGRLTIAQKIANKAAKIGVKTYELCESSTGYLWKFIIYFGADTTGQQDRQTDGQDRQTDGQDRQTDGQNRQTDGQDRQTDEQDKQTDVEPDGYTAKVVYQLATPLFGKGYTLVMDNFYNSPLLARSLKAKQTDVLGTLRVSREFVPESLKSVSKSELRVGEVVYSQTSDLTVFLWRDTNLVSMISTYHPVEIGAKEKYGKWRYKPQAVLDYNSLMGGVDKKDQLLSAFPMERIRSQVWYKKLFRRLLNVTILNTHIIHSAHNKKMAQRQFRTVLAEELLSRFQPPRPSTTEVKVLSGQKRPILSGNHYIVKGATRHACCIWCRRNGRSSRTVYRCEQCTLPLCFDPCFKEYHTVRD